MLKSKQHEECFPRIKINKYHIISLLCTLEHALCDKNGHDWKKTDIYLFKCSFAIDWYEVYFFIFFHCPHITN